MTTSNKNKLLFFSGSNSTNSINQKLVETLARMTQTKTVKLIDLKDFSVPLYGSAQVAAHMDALLAQGHGELDHSAIALFMEQISNNNQ